MALQLELRRHPTDFFAVDRIKGERRGPLEPDDAEYPEAFRPMRSIWCDGKLIGYCNLTPGGPINLLPATKLVLPQITDLERKTIREFVESHMHGATPGRLVDPIREIPPEGPPDDEDEDDEDDDE